MELVIPRALATGVGATEDGARWITELPSVVDSAIRRWDLELGNPFPDGASGWTVPAAIRSGQFAGVDAVLKVVFPHEEARGEPEALALWRGHGTAQLLAADPVSWTLLLRRCRPGTPLKDDLRPDMERLAIAAHTLRRLHDAGRRALLDETQLVAKTQGGPRSVFAAVGPVAARWADLVTGRWHAARTRGDLAKDTTEEYAVDNLVALTANLLRELPDSTRDEVVIHGDANPGNLLLCGEQWLWIDPKPLIGDGAYDPWPLLWQVGSPFAGPDPAKTLAERVELVSGILGLDPLRVIGWTVARATEAALWSYTVLGDVPSARKDLERARLMRTLLGGAGDW